MRSISTVAAAAVALLLAAGSVTAKQDTAKCTQAMAQNKIEDIKLFCPTAYWPGDPHAGNTATLDEGRCAHAKKPNTAENVTLTVEQENDESGAPCTGWQHKNNNASPIGL